MEFVIFFAILSIAFSVWLFVYSGLIEDAFVTREKRAISDLGMAVQANIVTASNAHTGYYSSALTIPGTAGASQFGIRNTENVFVVSLIKDGQVKEETSYNIPYTIGVLKKGVNGLRNVNGVVLAGDVWISPVNYTLCKQAPSGCSSIASEIRTQCCAATGGPVLADPGLHICC